MGLFVNCSPDWFHPWTRVFPSSHNAFVPSSIMMSPAMTTQLPLLSLPSNSFLSSLSLSLSIVEKPSGQLPGQSVVGSDRPARGQGRKEGAHHGTIRWLIIGQNVWNFSGTMIPISPSFSCHSTLGHSHTSGPLSPPSTSAVGEMCRDFVDS